MLPLEVRFVQPQTYALHRDLKVMGGASPNQIKPIQVISDERLSVSSSGLCSSEKNKQGKCGLRFPGRL